LLSNLVLDELDRELERRGHRFVRYADDCNLFVGSERAGQRVMKSVTHFITHRLKLKVNQAKSAVARPGQRKFLGFSFTGEREPRRRIAPKAIARFKERIREQTRRTRGISLQQMVTQITTYLRDGSDTLTIVRRPRCCKPLNRGYAADFGRWCGSNGNGDGRDFANFANGM
jgi:RNA-directed DNA polymerase